MPPVALSQCCRDQTQVTVLPIVWEEQQTAAPAAPATPPAEAPAAAAAEAAATAKVAEPATPAPEALGLCSLIGSAHTVLTG